MTAGDVTAAAFLLAEGFLQLVGLVTVGRWLYRLLDRRAGARALARARKEP
jgi:hypothetical protein